MADFHFYPVIVHGNVATIYLHNNVLRYKHKYTVEIDSGVFTPATGVFAGFTKDQCGCQAAPSSIQRRINSFCASVSFLCDLAGGIILLF